MKTMPTLVALRANIDQEEQFVTYVTEGEQKGLLVMSKTEGLFSPKTTFAIEPDSDGLVSIRCCYNNKYLCRAPTVNVEDTKSGKDKFVEESESCMISLGAKEVVKERLAWDCTLFEIHFHDGDEDDNNDGVEIENVVSLIHVGTKYAVVVIPNDTNKEELSLIMKKCDKDEEAFHFTAMRSVVKLPKQVNFFGDNEMFIRYIWFENRDYNQFSGVDGLNLDAMYETVYRNNNRSEIRVKSLEVNKFWRRSPNWIWADSTDQTWNNPDTVFQVFRLPSNQITLRNNGNGRFCSRFTDEGKTSMLNANTTTMNIWSHLTVGEPIVSRVIKADYHIENANLVSLTPEFIGSIERTNEHYNTNQEERPNFSITRSATRSWSQTNTLTTSVTVTIEAGMPYIDISGSLAITEEKSTSVTWGKEVSESNTFGSESPVTIKPRTRATIRCFLLRARYDIPFSYVQTDIRATGETVVTEGTDGICQGVEGYHYELVTEFEPI